jgi:hypothetical protein
MQLKLVACEILYREFCAAVARSVNKVDLEFLPKGLHDIGQAGMNAKIREIIGQIDPSQYDAILLGYGLCSNGLMGLTAEKIPLVIPRAHDCITLFLGNKERYLQYFQSHPGVYFQTTGWLERGKGIEQFRPDAIQHRSGMTQTYEELAAKYGEDNAQFLRQQLGDVTKNYGQLAFIRMGIEPDDRFERQARSEADSRGWKFEVLDGNLGLIERLLDGPWGEDEFLIVPPGHRIAPSYDERIIRAELATG